MTQEEIKKIKEQIKSFYEWYEKTHLEDYEAEANYVPYGDTWVNAGSDYDDDVYEQIREDFVYWIENDNELVEEILEESHVEVNDENKKLVIEFAKEA